MLIVGGVNSEYLTSGNLSSGKSACGVDVSLSGQERQQGRLGLLEVWHVFPVCQQPFAVFEISLCKVNDIRMDIAVARHRRGIAQTFG